MRTKNHPFVFLILNNCVMLILFDIGISGDIIKDPMIIFIDRQPL